MLTSILEKGIVQLIRKCDFRRPIDKVNEDNAADRQEEKKVKYLCIIGAVDDETDKCSCHNFAFGFGSI
jgi:hypothetical protein